MGRLLIVTAVLLLAGCAEPEENFARVQGEIVAIEEECELEASETVRDAGQNKTRTKSVSREGSCAFIQNEARQSRYRGVELHRELDISYEFTSPVDNQRHRGTGEREQPLQDRVPAVGEAIEVLAHRTDADSSRLP